MTCGGCENAVKRAVGKVPGVTAVEASHTDERVTVTFAEGQADLEAVKAKITGLGYRVG